MIIKLKDFVKSEWPFVLAVLRQLAIPAVLAVAYGAYDRYSSKESFSFSAYLKVTLPALFFIMWIVGLFERAKKKSSDKDSFDNLNSGLQSLTELVKELKTSPHSGGSAAAGTAPSGSFSAFLINEAQAVYGAGFKLASLLQAGVAFEHAVRSFALHAGLEEAERMPLLKVLQKIDFLLPQGWRGEIHMLRKIRNQLAHATEQEIESIEPEFVLKTYALAVAALNGSRGA